MEMEQDKFFLVQTQYEDSIPFSFSNTWSIPSYCVSTVETSGPLHRRLILSVLMLFIKLDSTWIKYCMAGGKQYAYSIFFVLEQMVTILHS